MQNSTCFKAFLNEVDSRLDGDHSNETIQALIFSTCGDPDLVSVFDKRKWRFWITGVLTFVTGIVGLLGNILSILTLSDKSMRNVFNHLMMFLCTADLLVIISAMALSLQNLHPQLIGVLDPFISYSDCVSHVSITASVFFTISITIERYIAVCSPLTYQARVVRKGPTKIICSYLVPVIVMAVVLNIPKIKNLVGMELYLQINILYQVFHPLVTCCIFPLVTLTVLNLKIAKGSHCIRNSRLKPELSLYHVMMMVVVVFILVSLPRTSMALYEVSTINKIKTCLERRCGYYVTSGRWVADYTIRYLMVLNSSTNFIIYCFYGSKFRKVLKKNLCKIVSAFQTQSEDEVEMEQN